LRKEDDLKENGEKGVEKMSRGAIKKMVTESERYHIRKRFDETRKRKRKK
jgi:hypothetical protein